MFAPMAAMNPVCRSVVDFDISIASGGQGESVKGYAKRYVHKRVQRSQRERNARVYALATVIDSACETPKFGIV